MTRTVLAMEVEGVSTRGRPKLRYGDTIRRDMKNDGLTDVNTLDRNDWRMGSPGRPTDVEERSR